MRRGDMLVVFNHSVSECKHLYVFASMFRLALASGH